jgi:hypothetical protein
MMEDATKKWENEKKRAAPHMRLALLKTGLCVPKELVLTPRTIASCPVFGLVVTAQNKIIPWRFEVKSG